MKTAEEYKNHALESAKNKLEKYTEFKIEATWLDIERHLIAGKKSLEVIFLHIYGEPDGIIKHFNEVGITFDGRPGSGYDDDEFTRYIVDISVLYNKENQ